MAWDTIEMGHERGSGKGRKKKKKKKKKKKNNNNRNRSMSSRCHLPAAREKGSGEKQ